MIEKLNGFIDDLFIYGKVWQIVTVAVSFSIALPLAVYVFFFM